MDPGFRVLLWFEQSSLVQRELTRKPSAHKKWMDLSHSHTTLLWINQFMGFSDPDRKIILKWRLNELKILKPKNLNKGVKAG